jgi:drug/metabolite transporter (DMT)-like permease
VVQLLWKLGASQLNVALLALVGALFACQLWNWLRVLRLADLSYAQPLTSLSLISVLAFSVLYLGERLDAPKIAGIALIIAGVWLISRGPHQRAA